MKALAIGVALLDIAPLFLQALGLFFLAQLVDRLEPRCRRMARAGLVIVTLSGLARVVANLVLAVTGEGLPLLSATVLVFAGPGLLLMASAMMRARAASLGRPATRDPWIAPTAATWLVLGVAFFLNSRFPGFGWSIILSGLVLSATFILCAAAASLSWQRQLHMAAGLFALAATGTLAISILRAIDQNPWIQLFEVLIQVPTQGAFAFAAWRVAAEYHARVGPLAAS